MPDILGATNPVPGRDTTNVNRHIPLPQANEHVQNVPSTDRIVRPDGRAGQQEDAAQHGSIRYDSNFQVFLKRLRETPDAAESLRRIFAGDTGLLVSSGIQEGTAAELAQFLSMLHVDESALLQFLMGQIKSGTQFGGALFALLRNAYAKANSGTVQEGILRFLRSYLDCFSADRIQQNILRDLRQMADAMPASWAERLRQMTEQLEGLMKSGGREDSLLFLQRDLLPFMSQYISRNHDMGLPRQILNVLTLEIARYENAGEEALLDAFHQIKGYGTLRQQLAGIDDKMLLQLLHRSRANASGQVNGFADQLAEAAAKALRGNGSLESQQAFQELVRAILINESVYMPLNHYLLPLEMDGRMLFSEMWVDPDANDDEDAPRNGRRGGMKLLFKMDVEGVGLVDVILYNKGDKVELSLSCPDALTPFSKMIEQDMGKILRQNDLVPVQVSVQRMAKPVSLTQVFPKIFERKNSLNVKV